ncbi:alanine racemase [Tyzzerella sp. An114]|uniref:alanine racemase n=1 Tax=Tyzzerella sp. An114 TaxID=1965545 RepID=UPI000B44EA5C|nr:alanine racemase [Tyzzerella sp. An114]OUQ60363.1 alanine racemase [Tyzzerella sp. An114]HIT72444.1 alanine racemase [Candidatus Fimicola cottocaccae]
MTEYQRVTAEIDLDAVAYNIRNIRERVNKNSKIMGIVKADAYGHGAVEVSKVLLYNGADWLGVAMIDEAIQLRQNNIMVPILILGYTLETKIDDVVRYDIIQTVFSYDMAKLVSDAAVKQNKIAKIHIKVDTGMGRIGFMPDENIGEEVLKISKLPNIEINGIFTHFSTSDETDKSFTRLQIERFKYAIDEIEKRGINLPVKHCANSAAIMDLEDLGFNMVRAGVILYGMYPSDDVKKENLSLKPVMSIKTHISYVKNVGVGVPLSYGRTYYTDKESVIATVPVGYADGYIRRMQKGGRVIVNGHYAPIVGRVCMDQFMIDVTDIPDVKPGDDVILMGSDGNISITADEIAKVLDTINYEVVCMIGKRVPREYIKNNKTIKTVNFI